MARFPYVSADNLPTSLMPRLPLTLALGRQSVEVVGLLDTGAAVSVLPYQVGLALGAVWEEQTTVVPLVCSLGQFEARALMVMMPLANPALTPTPLPSGEGLRTGIAFCSPLLLREKGTGDEGKIADQLIDQQHLVMASHPKITPNEGVRLVFAWTQLETAPIIFGQMNFFLEFDVCFYRSQSLFDVRLKDGG